MALREVEVASYNNDTVVGKYYYDDVTFEIMQVYYKNTTTKPAFYQFQHLDGTLEPVIELSANRELTLNVPSGQRPIYGSVNVLMGWPYIVGTRNLAQRG